MARKVGLRGVLGCGRFVKGGAISFCNGGGASDPTFKGEGGCFYKGGGQALGWDGMANLAMSICFSISHIIGSKTARFQGTLGIAIAQNAPPQPQNGLKTLVWASQVVWEQLRKKCFFCPGDPGGPTVGPHCARAGLRSSSTK